MAMNLMDRPAFGHDALPHRAGGVTASMALHVVALAALLAIIRSVPGATGSDPEPSLIPGHIVWMPSIDIGGGRTSGGDHTIAPPRRPREVGTGPTSVSSPPPQPSTGSTVEPPEEIAAIPARPMGDASAPLAGVVDSVGAATAAGPGARNAGNAPGDDRGALGKFGNQVGPAAGAGGPGVTTPTLIQQVKPRYTADAMRLRIQGSVWVECVVLPDGTVGDARVIRSLDSRFGLDDEAIAAAKQWRFHPGTLNGRPVPVVVSIELTFSVR